MEIKNRKDISVNSGLVESLRGQKNPYQTQAANTAKQNTVGQDTVSVSEQSRTLNLASKILDQDAISRREKVESIKAKVNAGTYDVSSEKVASSIISFFSDDVKVGNL